MAAFKTTTEHAAEIRAAYKARGWSSRKVSVQAEYFSMGSAIRVTIKHPEVCMAEAERIAEEHASISRCEITHEILSGGNRYVTVSYSSECEKALGAPYVAGIKAALAELEGAERGTIAEVAGAEGYGLSREHGTYARLWTERGREMEFFTGSESGIEHGAFVLACLLKKS